MIVFKTAITISQGFLIALMLIMLRKEYLQGNVNRASVVGIWFMVISNTLCLIGVWL